MEVTTTSSTPAEKMKYAIQIFRDIPVLPEALLDLFRFCSDYYHHPLGAVVMNGLPAHLRRTKPLIQKTTPALLLYHITEAGRATNKDSLPARQITKNRLLAMLRESGPTSDSEIRKISPRINGLLKECIAASWIEVTKTTPASLPVALVTPQAPVLTTEQQKAVDSITARIQEFNVWLLHGITGSGKTEVYMRLISTVLQQGKQALILVPEINLTPQLETLFRTRFSDITLVSLHSKLTASERASYWLRAWQGKARIILGTRLAVFTPLARPGLIIVDEEQDSSLKQQDGLRYSARDLAIFQAKYHHIPIILGSATPSLESYYNATSQRYHKLTLSTRAVKDAALPAIHCVDTRRFRTHDGLSPPLIAALEKRLDRKQQSLVFINRRGYAPALMCKSCLWTAACQRCTSRLVVHLQNRKLRCHYCGHEENLPAACADCGNPDITPAGFGTQRIEASLEKRFPTARILRIDRDSVRLKNGWRDMLKEIHEQRVDILVGTQILAKGHDFPNMSFVGILNSDASLFSTDFRAAERLFAQLMQVAGRAGRASIPGEVLIQTEFPDHPLYQALLEHDYDKLAHTLLAERKIAGFPPFVYQALLRAEAPQVNTALDFLANAAAMAEVSGGVELFDPVPAQMARLKGLERAHLLVQSASRKQLQAFLTRWYNQLDRLPARKVRWSLDIDPMEF